MCLEAWGLGFGLALSVPSLQVALVAADVGNLLERFATRASFSADSRGGGRDSNARLLPYMLQLGRHAVRRCSAGELQPHLTVGPPDTHKGKVYRPKFEPDHEVGWMSLASTSAAWFPFPVVSAVIVVWQQGPLGGPLHPIDVEPMEPGRRPAGFLLPAAMPRSVFGYRSARTGC